MTEMTWPEAFAVVGGVVGLAILWGVMIHGWPTITINKHYHNTKKK